MAQKYNTLIMGASYGSLLAIKMLLAGHNVKLVCLPAEADPINRDGIRVKMPVRGRDELVEINSNDAPGNVEAGGTEAFDPNDFDLIALAMQEPQYKSPGVRELLDPGLTGSWLSISGAQNSVSSITAALLPLPIIFEWSTRKPSKRF